MATLSGTIDKQEIMDRFRDYVEADVNASIVWYQGNEPTMDTSPVAAGVTAVINLPVQSRGINPLRASSTWNDGDFAVSSGTFTNGTDQVIRAAELYNKLYAETQKTVRIFKWLLIGVVTGEGGNNGTRLTTTPNVVGRTWIELFRDTQVAYFEDPIYFSGVRSIAAPDNAGVAAGQAIDDTNLETFFSNLRDAFRANRDTVHNAQGNVTGVCHSSCHASCHGSRGRR